MFKSQRTTGPWVEEVEPYDYFAAKLAHLFSISGVSPN